MSGQPEIYAKFLGEGQVYVDGTPLAFPYARAKLLLFVLLETRRATREQLCAWIWEEHPATARQNLRNALTALRRLLPGGCIVSDRRTVRIEERCRVSSDLDLLDESPEGLELARIPDLSAPFLEGLPPDGSRCEWIEERRSHYRKKLHKLLTQCGGASERDTASGGPSTEAPFVRTGERDSILAFFATRPHPGTASLLCALVLGEEGSGKSVLSREILARKNAEGSICFHGRCREGEGNDPRALWGRILRKIVGNRPSADLGLSAFHLHYLASCFPDFPSKQESARRLPHLDFNPRLLGKIFALLFDRVRQQTRREIFLLLEDIHWSDRLMPDLLHGLFENAQRMAALMTCHPEFRTQLDAALNPPPPHLRLKELTLARLSYEQTELICRSFIPERELTSRKLSEIYEHTGGSPFLLQEFLSFRNAGDWAGRVSKSLHEAVSGRLQSLTEEERELLDCVAVFQEEAPFDALKHLSELNDAALIRVCEKLHRKGLLYDRAVDGNFVFLFRYPLIKRQIVSAMPDVRKWSLHRRMVEYLRGDGSPEKKNLSLLAWHARHAGDSPAELEARIHELKTDFEFTHELFPMLSDAELMAFPGTTTDIRVTETAMKEVRALLDRLVRTQGRTPRLLDFERTILTLEGGFLRWNGDYDDAAGCLDEALKLASVSPDRETSTIEVLEQLCYLGIQKDDPVLLRRYVFLFYRAAMRAYLGPQTGMGFRFLGILAIMEKRCDDATRLLKMSSRLFEKLESQGNGYTLSIIAAIHYHGDIAMYRGQHDQALTYYRQCVRLCEGKGFFRGLGLHIAKSAWCAARLGQVDAMREYLAFARPLFEGLPSRRGAGICGGEIVFDLSALLEAGEGAFRRAEKHLRQGEELSQVIRKPLWNAIHFCIRAVLKKSAGPALDSVLQEDAEHYLAEARARFERLGIPGEIEAFTQLGKLFAQ